MSGVQHGSRRFWRPRKRDRADFSHYGTPHRLRGVARRRAGVHLARGREVEARPVEPELARPPVLPTEDRRQRAGVGRHVNARQPADLATAANEACPLTEEHGFCRRHMGGRGDRAQREVACEMIDRHGGQRAGLCVRPQVAVGAEENLANLACLAPPRSRPDVLSGSHAHSRAFQTIAPSDTSACGQKVRCSAQSRRAYRPACAPSVSVLRLEVSEPSRLLAS